MTFAPELPEEARGDQFETATPVHLNEVIQEEHEEPSVTAFDYSAIEIHTEETPTEETSDTDAPPTETYTDAYSEIEIPNILNELEEVKTEEPGDQSEAGAAATTPYTLPVSSTAATTPSQQDLATGSQLSQETTKVSVQEDVEGSGSRGTDDETEATVEGSGDESSAVTDETEIGGTEPTTLVPNTTPPEATAKSHIEDLEGSASGEDEASGDDTYPTESPVFTSTLPPVHSSPRSQQPPSPAAEVTAVAPLVFPDGDAVTENGSGADQLSGEGEASGQPESGDDLNPEVIVTVLPDAATAGVEDLNKLPADTTAVPSESSTTAHFTSPSSAATEKTPTSLTSEHTPTTPPASKVYMSPTEHSSVTSKPHVDQLSGQGEASGQEESVVDLTQEVIVTVSPEVAAVTVGDQTTIIANTAGTLSRSSTAAHSTQPSFAATDEKHTSFTTERAPTTPEDHTSPSSEVYTAQAEWSGAASKQPQDRHTTLSTTLPSHAFNHSTHSVPQRVPTPDAATTPLPDDYVDYDKEVDPPLLESLPQITEETAATEEPERGTDSNYSVEGNTVNIRGT